MQESVQIIAREKKKKKTVDAKLPLKKKKI